MRALWLSTIPSLPDGLDLSLWRALRNPDWRTFYADSMLKMSINPEEVEREMRRRDFVSGQLSYQLDTPVMKALQAAAKPILDSNGSVVGIDLTCSPSLRDLTSRMNSDLPLPTNISIEELFSNATHVRVQRLFQESVIVAINRVDELQVLRKRLSICEPLTVQPCCLCADELSFEFFRDSSHLAKLTYHAHSEGSSASASFLRWDAWRCDALIVDSGAMSTWLAIEGLADKR